MKNIMGNFLRITVSLGFLLLIILKLKGSMVDIKDLILSANLGLIGLSLLVYLICTFIMAWRLKIVLSGQDIYLPIRDTWLLYWVGYFFNMFLPSSVGGDIVKAYYAGAKTKKKMQSYTSILMDRFFGMFAIMIVCGIALLVYGRDFQYKTVTWTVAAIIAGMFFIGLFLWSKTLSNKLKSVFGIFKNVGFLKKIQEKLSQAYDILHSYRDKKKVISYSLIISILNQMLFVISVFLIGMSLSCDLGISKYFVLVPIIGAMTTLPSINGLGIREGAFVLLFSGLIIQEKAMAISIIWSSMAMLMSLIGGIVYMTHPDFRIKKNQIQEESE